MDINHKNAIQCKQTELDSVLVQMDGLTILVDPLFSDRCSLVQFLRPNEIDFRLAKLRTHIDAIIIIISHNHYDHLDHGGESNLNSNYDDKITWFVASGTKEWMINTGCKNMMELSWWEEAEFPERPDFKFASVPCHHRCNKHAIKSDKVCVIFLRDKDNVFTSVF